MNAIEALVKERPITILLRPKVTPMWNFTKVSSSTKSKARVGLRFWIVKERLISYRSTIWPKPISMWILQKLGMRETHLVGLSRQLQKIIRHSIHTFPLLVCWRKICTYIHTYIHTYTHTHIHTYIHKEAGSREVRRMGGKLDRYASSSDSVAAVAMALSKAQDLVSSNPVMVFR